jgi:hypothetical protein
MTIGVGGWNNAPPMKPGVQRAGVGSVAAEPKGSLAAAATLTRMHKQPQSAQIHFIWSIL